MAEIKRYITFADKIISLEGVGEIYEGMRQYCPRDDGALRLELAYLFSQAVRHDLTEEEEHKLYKSFKEMFDFSTYFKNDEPWEKVRRECFEDPSKNTLIVGEGPVGTAFYMCDRKKNATSVKRRKGQKF